MRRGVEQKDQRVSELTKFLQVAFQQADYAAWNIWAAIHNRALLPFRYQHLGDMMSLGEHTMSCPSERLFKNTMPCKYVGILQSDASLRDYTLFAFPHIDLLVDVFYLVTATSALTILGSVFVEWRSVKATAREQGLSEVSESREL